MERVKVHFTPSERAPTALRPDAPSRRDKPQFVEDAQPVVIIGLRVPFLQMVGFLLKLMFAAATALLLLTAIAYGGKLLWQIYGAEIVKKLSEFVPAGQ